MEQLSNRVRSGKLKGIDPRDVQTRHDLSRYLEQSLPGDYVESLAGGDFSQRATHVKSYLVEADQEGRDASLLRVPSIFPTVLKRNAQDLLLLIDKGGEPYFADLSDRRFIIIHSIAKAEVADRTIERLTEGDMAGFDRGWLSTEFLLATGVERGSITGFRFQHDLFVDGLTESDSDVVPGIRQQGARPPRSRIVVTGDFTSLEEYRRMRDSNLFGDRKALEHIEFVSKDQDGGFIVNGVYSSGKVIGKGNSIGSHLNTIISTRRRYSLLLEAIEDRALGWNARDNRHSYSGEPFIIKFPTTSEIVDLTRFVASVFRPTKPFRLFGVPSYISDERIDLDVIDLHNGDPIRVEITKRWIRIYLPKGSCGNVLMRLYTHLQHTMSSGIVLATGSGELLFDT